MPSDRSPKDSSGASQDATPDDNSLIIRVGRGDEEALRMLMDRYDRVVRYTVFRTAREQSVRDPQWLDAVASETWEGFLKSARRGANIKSGSVCGYLSGIARQQTISALRRSRAFAIPKPANVDAGSLSVHASTDDDPATVMSELESLTSLRDCAAQLPEEDKQIMAHLQAITQRRWVDAGAALGLSESTLRSKWERIVQRLRNCMEKKGK